VVALLLRRCGQRLHLHQCVRLPGWRRL